MKDIINFSAGKKPFALGSKPLESVERLVNCCLPLGVIIETKQPETLIPLYDDEGEQQVILVKHGRVNIYRTSDGLLYGLSEGLSLMGVLASDFRREKYSFSATKNSIVMVLSRQNAINLIIEHGLIDDLLMYYSYITDCETYVADLMISRNTYEIICGLLKELQLYPDDVRCKLSVANYIVARTQFARSGIMKILADLRTGGYIEIQNGKLIRVIRNFPDCW